MAQLQPVLLAERLDELLDGFREGGRFDGVGCLLLDDHASLRYASASGDAGRTLVMAEEAGAEGPGCEAFLTQESQAVADVITDSRFGRLSGLLTGTAVVAVIAIPVRVGGRTVGALDLFASTVRPWQRVDIQAAERCAQAVGAAIEHAFSRDDQYDALVQQVVLGLSLHDTILQGIRRFEQRQAGSRVAAERQLRQVAAILGRGVVEVSQSLVDHGQVPTPHLLAPLIDYRLHVAVRHVIGTAVSVVDRDLRFVLVLGSQQADSGWRSETLIGRTVRQVTTSAGADPAPVEALVTQALDGVDSTVAEYPWTSHERWYRLQASPVLDRRGEVVAALLVATDVTQQREDAAQLALLRRHFETAFLNAPSGLALLTPSAHFLDLNDHLAALLGVNRTDVLGRQLFDFVHRDDTTQARDRWQEVLERPGRHIADERRYIRPNGDTVWVTAHMVLAAGDAAGDSERGSHVVMQCQDETARRLAEQDLRRLTLLDPLTGLGNRVLLNDRLTHALSQQHRHPRGLAVVYLDLNRFKVINDSLGHDAGDEVLVNVANRLRAALRPEDTIARLGGDEFAILCEDVCDPAAAHELGTRIAHAVNGDVVVRRPGTERVEPVAVEASVGVVLAGPEHVRPVDLLRDADLAMYAAKGAGHGQVRLHTHELRRSATRRQRLESALRRAVVDEMLQVAYQPVVDLIDGSTVGFEALARWRDPEHGDVSPVDFIPIAEETGLIVELGTLVLRRAVQQLRTWLRDERTPQVLHVAVNVSARQLTHPSLLQLVSDSMNVSELGKTRLVLEITESALVEAAGPASGVINQLKAVPGVSISIDDFGTGYSSLAYLTRLPIDGLKIDRAFVRGLSEDNQPDAAVAGAVLGLAHTLGLRATAEGVENETQANKLRGLGCPYAQGFLYAPALTPEAATAWLQAHNSAQNNTTAQ